MCGILGIINLDKKSINIGTLTSATLSLRHRGPDDEGYLLVNTKNKVYKQFSGNDSMLEIKNRYENINKFKNNKSYNLAFGFRRLSIIDLSSSGHQPMKYRENWIIYNGEIFNYKELKQELTLKGYKFDTKTDTEVILASYLEWGEKCVLKFNGQWAFCIYDTKKDILFCSRDRFGIIPFYYYYKNNIFAFASEIKALLQLPFIDKTKDEELIFDFLIWGLLDHTGGTLYKNIKQIKPGHNLIFDLKTGRIKTYKYYHLSFNPELGKYEHTRALRYADDIRELLIDAVRLRLRADVPIGSCLSGGLDSSSIVVIINKLLKEQKVEQIKEIQKTFTASYTEKSVDESNFVTALKKTTEIDSYFTYPKAKGLWDEFDRVVYHQDEVFASSSIYAQWCVMKLASSKVKVVLDGQGGDELFGGYNAYDSVMLSHLIKEIDINEILNFIYFKIKMYGIGSLKVPIQRVLFFLFIPDFFKEKLFQIRSKITKEIFNRRRLKLLQTRTISNFNERLFIDETSLHLPQLLHYEDRNGMAHSVEARVPFLDHRLVEYVFNIPAIYKFHRGYRKWLLRLAMRDLLPEIILWRKDKIGFATPEDKWVLYKKNPLKKFMEEKKIKRYISSEIWRSFLVDRFLNF